MKFFFSEIYFCMGSGMNNMNRRNWCGNWKRWFRMVAFLCRDHQIILKEMRNHSLFMCWLLWGHKMHVEHDSITTKVQGSVSWCQITGYNHYWCQTNNINVISRADVEENNCTFVYVKLGSPLPFMWTLIMLLNLHSKCRREFLCNGSQYVNMYASKLVTMT